MAGLVGPPDYRQSRPAGHATVLLSGETPMQSAPPAAGEPSPRERVHHFYAIASPPAFRLATLLAAVPVNLQVARHMQAELVPESGPDHLVEVLASGLLQPSGMGTDRPWDSVTFEIPEAVRAELLGGARRSETARAVKVAAERFGDQLGGLNRLRYALDDPDRTPDPVYTAETAEEVAIERTVMRALSGPYRSRADRFDRVRSHVHPHPHIGPPSEPLHHLWHDRHAGGGTPAAALLRGAPVDSEPIVSESMPDRTDLADAPATPSIVAHKTPAVASAPEESMFGRGPGDTAVPPSSSSPSRAAASPLRKVGSVLLI
jgi:hypothetical protein